MSSLDLRNPGLHDLIAPDPRIERVAGGLGFTEGPVWWVCRADGTLLGRIILPELPANLAWGEDGSVLFLTARTSVYRVQTRTRGALLD